MLEENKSKNIQGKYQTGAKYLHCRRKKGVDEGFVESFQVIFQEVPNVFEKLNDFQ